MCGRKKWQLHLIQDNKKSLKRRNINGFKDFICGTPEGIRTPDLLVRSQTLYPTELPAHIRHNLLCLDNITHCNKKCNTFFKIKLGLLLYIHLIYQHTLPQAVSRVFFYNTLLFGLQVQDYQHL